MRHHDWPIRFEAFIAERRHAPFQWGKNDCAILAADHVTAITGCDVVPTSLRRYASAKEAYRLVRANGGLAGLATLALGAALPANLAQVGDIVLCKAGKRNMLAICNGRLALAPGPDGLESVARWSMCWRVA